MRTIGNLTISGSLITSGSIIATTFIGDGAGLTGVTSYTDADTLDYINSIGVVSSSAQLSTEISGAFVSVSASIASDIANISTDFADITNKPTLISSSLQVDYNSIQNQPTIPTNNNQLTNGAGYTTCVGDITGVTAGTGLNGGGTTGTVTVNVNSDQRGSIVLIGQDTNDYIHVNTTVIDFRLDGNLDMRLENDGDLHVDGDVIAYSTTTSDIRFKDNINTIENSLDKIKAIRGVEFVWNAGGRKGEYDLGVIAQEVEEIIPIIVREKKLPMFDNSDTTYKTVDYEKLIPLLIESVKELSYQIEHLKNSNNGITK